MNSIHLPSTDQARSEAFYTTYFGFRRKTALGPVVFLESLQGFLLSIEEGEDKAQFPAGFHVGFIMESQEAADALHEALLNAKIPISHPLLWRSEGHIIFLVTDPDGLKIQISWFAGANSPQQHWGQRKGYTLPENARVVTACSHHT